MWERCFLIGGVSIFGGSAIEDLFLRSNFGTMASPLQNHGQIAAYFIPGLIPEQWPDGRDHGPVLGRSKLESETCDKPGAYVDRTTASPIRSTSPPRSVTPPAPPPLPFPPPHRRQRDPRLPSPPPPSRPAPAPRPPPSLFSCHRCCCSRLASSLFCTFIFVLWLVHVAVPISPRRKITLAVFSFFATSSWSFRYWTQSGVLATVCIASLSKTFLMAVPKCT